MVSLEDNQCILEVKVVVSNLGSSIGSFFMTTTGTHITTAKSMRKITLCRSAP
jgi:hypothetical protein